MWRECSLTDLNRSCIFFKPVLGLSQKKKKIKTFHYVGLPPQILRHRHFGIIYVRGMQSGM